MSTLAEFCLELARNLGDVVDGTATAGSANSVVDAVNLDQTAGYWDGGTVWILSGTYVGEVSVVRNYTGNKLTFDALAGSVGLASYAVARGLFPWRVMKNAVNTALASVRVQMVDESLTATTAKVYSLPAGVRDVVNVETDEDGVISRNTHWQVVDGEIMFDSAPNGTIRLLYMGMPDALSEATDVVPAEINPEWLKWSAMVNCLRWGMRSLQKDPVYDTAEFLNEAYKRVAELKPFRRAMIRMRTA